MTGHSKVALITGAASGIGRAAAQRMSANGWAVVAADLSAEALEEAFGGRENVATAAADVSRPEDNVRLVDLCVSRFGGLNAAVLNAGTAASASIESAPLEQFESAISVNLMGAVHGVRAALPALRNAVHPSIVITASMNGVGGDNSMTAYCASKFGAVGLVKSLAREIGFEGIRVNAVCPGATRTGMTIPYETAMPELAKAIAEQIPLQRWAEPEEVAAAIEFLASPAASYITGVALPVDGGASSGVGLRPPARSPEDVLSFTFASS